jgi:hypothetical protein
MKSSVLASPDYDRLLRIIWIIEQDCELDASMTELGEVKRVAITRIEIRCRVVWGKKNERV